MLDRVLTWPPEAQEEAVASLATIEEQFAALQTLAHEDLEALARSDEDMRLGRYATDEEVKAVFDRYRRVRCSSHRHRTGGHRRHLCLIRKDNPTAAASVAAAIQRTIMGVAKRPNLAPFVYKRRVRAKLVERSRHRIFYEVDDDMVVIKNIRSTRRLRPWED